MHRGLSRGMGIMLVVTCVLFQRRGLLTWQEAAFMLACVVMQEGYLQLRALNRVRPLLIGSYFALPTAMLLSTLPLIEPYRGNAIDLMQNTPVPVVLVSVQVMVLYVRESPRLSSIVLVLALFAVVIGLKRPVNDVTWTWLLAIGVIAAAYVALTFPARTYYSIASARSRASAPRVASSPAGVARPEYLMALGSACTLVPIAAVALFFLLPRIDLGAKMDAVEISGDPNNPTPFKNPNANKPKSRDGGKSTREPNGPTVTGMANHVNLGDFGAIKRDTTELGTIVVPGRRVGAPVYLRASTLSRFDGEQWLASDSRTGRVDIPEAAAANFTGGPERQPGQADRRRYEIKLKAAAFGADGEVPLVSDPLMIRGLQGRATWDPTTGTLFCKGFTNGAEYMLDASVLTQRPEQIAATLRGKPPVRVENSVLPDEYWDLPPDLLAAIRQRWTHFTKVNERAWSYKDDRGRNAYSAYAAARYIVDYFRDATFGGKQAYEYSLEKRPKAGADSIFRFLTTERYGHCEYFASAACAVLRAAGIPCRLAAGFAVTDYDEVLGVFTVLASDAHAWIEVYTEEYGWLALDPTPAQGQARPSPANVSETPTPGPSDPEKPDPAKEPEKPAAVENRPRDPFESFTRDSQSELVRNSREAIDNAMKRADETLAPLTNWMPSFMPQHGLWRVMLLGIGPSLLFVVWMWRRGKRRTKERRVLEQMGVPTEQARQRGLYAQLLLLLAKHGYHKRSHETPREFAARIVEKSGPAFAALQPLTEIFYLARFSLTKAAAEAEKEFKHGLSAFAAQLRLLAKASPERSAPGGGSGGGTAPNPT
ncbi:MAG: DUF4129 domain-containing protein [Planctomycetes bacterium]|nr:DUF4129 domain-containing protein [Planctomycetota bacterium]